ncbi:MAG: PspC domain-containing protein [Clostridia bacterium]|nr:PspC domain-containing protein [Clostridia bacterium]MDY6417502.1 PspC domain-containing protein [Bacteroidales bacterium]
MKEIERVSLGGYAFTLESDAARLAEEYLGELEKYYDGRAGGGEILDGIEERMAELLMEKAGRDGVVSRPMIEEAIGILGRPEDIEAAEEEAGAEGNSPAGPANDGKGTSNDERRQRKLYRDLENKMVAGVCSGLAAYFKQDVALFRILFVLFTVVFTFGFWHHGVGWRISMGAPTIYVILWICMPAAKTVRQRWEQRGEDGTLNSIQRSVEAGAKEFEEAVKSVGQSSAWSEFANIFGKLIGVVLLIVGFAGLFTGSLWGFGSGWLGNRHGDGFLGLGRLYDQGLTELHMYAPQAAHALAQPGVNILVALVCFLPFLGILYGALQLLFGFKPPKWHPGLVIFILWLLSVVALGILVATGFISTELLTV